jgi:hypothetical protein
MKSGNETGWEAGISVNITLGGKIWKNGQDKTGRMPKKGKRGSRRDLGT